jgi:polar amino acid transport system substrate-binding protein
MTADILDRIKRPYFTTRDGGSGLGIAVARGLVEQHGGRLEYESVPGRGTTATIILPACAKAAAKEAELPNPAHRHEPAVSA